MYLPTRTLIATRDPLRRLTSLDFFVEQELYHSWKGSSPSRFHDPMRPEHHTKTVPVLRRHWILFLCVLSPPNLRKFGKMCLPSFQLAMDRKPDILVLTSRSLMFILYIIALSFSKAYTRFMLVTLQIVPNSWDIYIYIYIHDL